MRRCRGPHAILRMIDWIHAGVACRCTRCDQDFFLTETDLVDYVPFVHTSTEGPDHDVTLLVHKSEIGGR